MPPARARPPDVTGCRAISRSGSGHFPGATGGVDQLSPPPSGTGPAVRDHRTSPQGAELAARHIIFSSSQLGCRGEVAQARGLRSRPGALHAHARGTERGWGQGAGMGHAGLLPRALGAKAAD
jgi:hypothetical protein